VLPWLALAWISALVVATAWLSDDAFITFRSVDNLVNGYGPTWNSNERVQAFTNTLWMFLHSGLYYFWRNLPAVAYTLSIAVSLLTCLLILWRYRHAPTLGALALLVLSASPSFIDYSTSGLENPLTHLLAVLFVLAWESARGARCTESA
jgi:arabinofuranosyltransferase